MNLYYWLQSEVMERGQSMRPHPHPHSLTHSMEMGRDRMVEPGRESGMGRCDDGRSESERETTTRDHTEGACWERRKGKGTGREQAMMQALLAG